MTGCNTLRLVQARKVRDAAARGHGQVQRVGTANQAIQTWHDALYGGVVFTQHGNAMQRTLGEKAFHALVDGVCNFGRRLAAQHFGLHGASELGHRPIACANLIPLRGLQQGQGDRLKRLVAKGTHQHAGVYVNPRPCIRNQS